MPIDFQPAPGARARLDWTDGRRRRSDDLGELRPLVSSLAIAAVTVPGIERALLFDPVLNTPTPSMVARPSRLSLPFDASRIRSEGVRAAISVDGHTLYTIIDRGGPALEFRPARPHAYFMPLPDSHADPEMLAANGIAELRLRGTPEAVLPFVRWRKREWVVRYRRSGLRRRIARGTGRTARVVEATP